MYMTVPHVSAGPTAALLLVAAVDPLQTFTTLMADDVGLPKLGFRMFDPSYAGYEGGTQLPVAGESCREAQLLDIVKDFGAVPDDGKSDSAALDAAIASVKPDVPGAVSCFSICACAPAEWVHLDGRQLRAFEKT